MALCFVSMAFTAQARRNGGIGSLIGDRSCLAKYEAKYEGTFCESLTYLRANLAPLNSVSQIFGDRSVVFLGDTHPNALIKKWIVRNLEELKASGFTHLALEALNSESQGLLENYFVQPSLRPQILKLIADDWGWIPEEHLQLIDAAHAAGLEVVAIDNRNELDRQGYGNDIQRRNLHMTANIVKALNSKGAGRVLVLTGKVHSALDSDEDRILTLPEMLDAQNVPNVSVDVETGEEPVPANITQAFLQEFRLGSLGTHDGADYYLVTPQKSIEADAVLFVGK